MPYFSKRTTINGTFGIFCTNFRVYIILYNKWRIFKSAEFRMQNAELYYIVGADSISARFCFWHFSSSATESNQRMPPKRRGFKNCGFKTVFVKKLKFNIKIENSFKTLFFHILSPLETPLPDNVYRNWCIFRINVAE